MSDSETPSREETVAVDAQEAPLSRAFATRVTTFLRAVDGVGSFWQRSTLTLGLLAMGTAVVVFGIGYRVSQGGGAWPDIDVIACLSFALLMYALATISSVAARRERGRQLDCGVRILESRMQAPERTQSPTDAL